MTCFTDMLIAHMSGVGEWVNGAYPGNPGV